jgi:hypothetical protein
MAKQQFDLFEQPPPELAKAHRAEEVAPVSLWKPRPGNKFYEAGQALVHFTDYLKLNDWQKAVLWPHLKYLVEEKLRHVKEDHEAMFEMGYVISAMEIEQLRSRSEARIICERYGVTF